MRAMQGDIEDDGGMMAFNTRAVAGRVGGAGDGRHLLVTRDADTCVVLWW